jgi:Gpi18-like mannosyltransferase
MNTLEKRSRLTSITSFFQRRPIIVLLIILLVGLVPRIGLASGVGFSFDQGIFLSWAQCVDDGTPFDLYQCQTEANHPPLGPILHGISLAIYQTTGGSVAATSGADLSAPANGNTPPYNSSAAPASRVRPTNGSSFGIRNNTLANNAALTAALKIPNIIFEYALISLLFYVAYQRAGIVWAIAATVALTFNLGWLVVTWWWGQTDVIFSFFLLLTTYLLTKRRVRWAWAVYGLAWLAKFQSIMIAPLLFVLSVRRCGLCPTLKGMIVFTLVLGGGLLPFLIGSGTAALTPYSSGAVNQFSYITANAYNLWYWIDGGLSLQAQPADSTLLFGNITYFQAGLGLFAIATAFLCLRGWFVRDRDDDYLMWAATCCSFFMLPTQIHERYLFPAIMFLAIALLRDWRLIMLYGLASIAFTDNILDLVSRGNPLIDWVHNLIIWSPVDSALLLTIAYIILMGVALRPLLSWRPSHQPIIATPQS